MAELHPQSAYSTERYADPAKKLQFSDSTMRRFNDQLSRYPTKMAALLPTLHLAQEEWGWISPEAMTYIAELLDLAPSYVYGVVTFYHMYNMKPVGKYHLQVCTNLSCMLNGAYDIYENLHKKLGCNPGEISADGRFSYTEVECLGSCDTAPVVQVNNDYYEKTSVDQMNDLMNKLK